MLNHFMFAAATADQPNPLMSFAPIFFIMIIFYFLLIRPQQKKQQETQKMIENIKKGDKVVTAGGVIGVVATLQDDYVVLKVGDNDQMKMEVLKSAISGIRK